ncbi:MAG TPA: ankyrin repeat domain-containing protein [Rickettsia endosymbiont of Omalisus fontisbellaquei]|nr:ankyrin repeat domain-containing protein [Rickettsia endosymbiont of Omalisus fontisbellaquei]
MQKIVLQGYDLGGFPNQENIATIYKEKDIEAYLNQKTADAREIFIYAHGNQYFSEENLLSPPNLKLALENDASEFAQNILSKIAQNTEESKPNIVHIFSCHSGTAQHNIQDVKGNIVVCTYAPATHTTNGYINELLFNIKNNFDNLNDFIVKNLPLLTAIGFGISYKLDGVVYPLIFDNNLIKTMDMTSFSTFLQEQYIKVQEFYTNLQGKFAGEHPELFPEYNFSQKMSYSAEELKKAFNIILNLNSEKLSLPEIEHLLEIDSSYVGNIFADSLELEREDVIQVVVNKIEKVESTHLHAAVKFNNLVLLNSLLNKAGKVGHEVLHYAIQEQKIEAAKVLINKIENVENIDLFTAIYANNLPILKILVTKTEQLDNNLLDFAINRPTVNIHEHLNIIETLFDKIEETSFFLNHEILLKAIKGEYLSLAKKVIYKMDACDITDKILDSAVEKGNSNIVKILLDKIVPTSSLIRAINSKDLLKVEELLKISSKIQDIDIAAIILSDNLKMVKSLINIIGDDKILLTAIKFGNSLVVQNILNEREKNGDLDKDKLDKIFEIAVKESSGNVIEDIMDKMTEVTDKHLMTAIDWYTPERTFIFEKVYNRVEKIESRLIGVAVNSENPYIVEKVADKIVGDRKDFFLQHNLYKALGSSNMSVSIVISNILLDKISKIQDDAKYALLDLTAKGNSYGLKNFYLFEKILDKSGTIDEEHVNTYLNLIGDPSIAVFQKLNNMKYVAQDTTLFNNSEIDIISDNVAVIGEIDFIPVAG